MSIAATITLSGVEMKTTSRGPVWKLHSTDGREFATFEAALGNLATGYGGQVVNITYNEKSKEKDGRTYTDFYLASIEPAPAGVAAAAVAAAPAAPAVQARTTEGGADWDKIGLQKTRCALWGAFLSSPTAAATAAGAVAAGQHASHAVFTLGRQIVEMAEFDVYTRSQPNPEVNDPTVPF